MITDQIISHLLEDELVVADLTDQNANVFYELAIRHATRKPAVMIIAEGETIPFDLSQSRAIMFDYRDLDSAAQCKKDLEEQIRALEERPDSVFSPVSMSVDLRGMRESDDPTVQRDAQIISAIQSVQADVARLGRRIDRSRLSGLSTRESSSNYAESSGSSQYVNTWPVLLDALKWLANSYQTEEDEDSGDQ